MDLATYKCFCRSQVLEALHYCPASEDNYRTAKITWRLLDSSSSPPPELHLITSNTQPSHHDDALLSSDTGVEQGLQELDTGQKFVSFSLPVVSSASSGLVHKREISSRLHTLPISASWQQNGKSTSALRARPVSPRTCKKSSECESHHPECCLHAEALAHYARTPQIPLGCPVLPARCSRGSWYDADELVNLEVVQSILREEPHYSSTCWSTVDEIDAARSHENFPEGNDLLGSSYSEIRNVKFEANCVSKRRLFQRKECLCLSGKDNNDVSGEESDAPSLEQPILCSTLRSDSDSEEANMEVCDEWPHSCGLHAKEVPSTMKECVCWAKGWRWVSNDGQVRASTTLPGRRYCHDLTKYKTEMCRSFQYNSHCGYGDACLYAHGSLDLRLSRRHPMYRTKQCFSFHHKGYCLYGSRCQFVHDLG